MLEDVVVGWYSDRSQTIKHLKMFLGRDGFLQNEESDSEEQKIHIA